MDREWDIINNKDAENEFPKSNRKYQCKDIYYLKVI